MVESRQRTHYKYASNRLLAQWLGDSLQYRFRPKVAGRGRTQECWLLRFNGSISTRVGDGVLS